jgi:AcrR family transcriptional regulator
VVKNQRDRLTAGVLAAVAEHGYHDATVTRICAAAGLSRRTFYAYFSTKEECYLQTFDLIVDFLVAAMEEASDGGDDWPVRARARLDAMLQAFAANPDLVRFVVIAPLRAGGEMARHQGGGMEQLLRELTQDREPGSRKVSPAVEQAQMGGIMALIAHKVEAGEGDRLIELLPDLVELFLTPYLGRERAGLVSAGQG